MLALVMTLLLPLVTMPVRADGGDDSPDPAPTAKPKPRPHPKPKPGPRTGGDED